MTIFPDKFKAIQQRIEMAMEGAAEILRDSVISTIEDQGTFPSDLDESMIKKTANDSLQSSWTWPELARYTVFKKGHKGMLTETGVMKNSIQTKRHGEAEFGVGIYHGTALVYAATHEFGRPPIVLPDGRVLPRIPRRSFLRTGAMLAAKEIKNHIDAMVNF